MSPILDKDMVSIPEDVLETRAYSSTRVLKYSRVERIELSYVSMKTRPRHTVLARDRKFICGVVRGLSGAKIPMPFQQYSHVGKTFPSSHDASTSA